MAGFNPNTWPTFQQSMPVTQGAMTGEQLLRAHLQNQMQKQQNEARPSMDAAKLAQILQQNEAQPGMDAAKLSQVQSSTKGQDISNQQAPEYLALRKHLAETGDLNAKSRQQQIGVQNEKMNTYKMRALTALFNTPQGRAQLEKNPDLLRNILSTQGAYAEQAGQSIGAPTIGGFTNEDQNNPPIGFGGTPQPSLMSQPPPQSGNQGINAAIQQGMQQQQAQPQQPEQPQPQHSQQATDQQIAAIQDLLASKNIKDTSTPQILNQRNFAGSLKAIGDPLEEKLKSVSKYFGFEGKAKLAIDVAKGKKGNNTPELKIYKQLVKDDFPLYANEFGRAAGNNATDQQKKAMSNMATPDWLMSNPELALSTFQGLRANERKIAKQLSKSLAQTQQQLSESDSTDQQPQAQPSNHPPPVVRAAPAGTVEMIDENGQYRPVPQDQLQAALKHGWRQS